MMKQVFRIAIKDFQVQLKSILSYLVIGFVMIIVFSLINLMQKQMVYALVAFSILYGFVNKALYEDERNNTLRLLAAMPAKRDVIVYARYLSTGVFMFALCLTMMLITGFTDLIVLSTVEPTLVIIIASIFMVFMILLSVYLPLAFKLGYIKAAGINRFVLLGMFALVGGVTAVFAALKNKESDIPQKLRALDATFTSMNPAILFIILTLCVMIAYLGSMRISIKVFRKRALF
jgi:ABC-2 type transport system permease protein